MRRIVLTFAFLILTGAAFAQGNSCAYTFTYTSQSFKFCLTSYGTLAMLQAPIGVDLVDPTNPVEGYWYSEVTFIGGGSQGSAGSQIPGLGYTDDGQCLSSGYPNKLPLVFTCGRFTVTVTANAKDHSVTFNMKDQNYGPSMWTSGMGRIINVLPNSTIVPIALDTMLSSFVYVNAGDVSTNRGVMISVPRASRFNYKWATVTNGCQGGAGAGLCSYATEGNSGRGTTSLNVTYRVF